MTGPERHAADHEERGETLSSSEVSPETAPTAQKPATTDDERDGAARPADTALPTAPPTSGRRGGRRPHRGGVVGLLRETVIVVGTALVLSLLIKTFLVQAFYIPSESMEDTLEVGDRVLVSQLTPGPFDLKRGDVVVFKDPGGWLGETAQPQRSPVGSALVSVLTFVGVLPQDAGEHLIKRLIGLPSDRVACCDDQGRVTVNGEPLQEPYLAPGAVPSERTFDVVVPEGRIWVMGDNRQNSRDSRWHMDLEGQGTISEDLVVGRAFVTIWPVARWTWLSDYPKTFADVPAAPTGGDAGPP